MTRRTLARFGMTAVMWPLAQAALHACPICFQINDAHMSSGVRAGVGVLIAVTIGVVGVCVVFFGRVARRQ